MVTFSQNLRDGLPTRLMGLPVIFSEKVAAPGSAGDVILADFSYYVIGDRRSLAIASSEHYRFLNDQMTWRFTHRMDGQPWIKAPITLADNTNTVSPFVYLN
jgi:HK97 family phage major capsid protein